MMLTRVVNLHKAHADVYVGRPSIFGNPFHVEPGVDRLQVIERYRLYFLDRVEKDPEFRAAAEELRGKALGCHCKPKPCHADVIAAWCNGELP